MDSSCDAAWVNFLKNGMLGAITTNNIREDKYKEVPKCSELYISTKTKIGYLNTSIDLSIFWDIPILNFNKPENGIIKKQIKLTLTSKKEIETLYDNIKKESYVNLEHISLKKLPNNSFKDVRKLSIGLSNKDITRKRTKKKGAFYNCFVLIMRIFFDNAYRQVHVKVFNTGKLEIPGIKSNELFDLVINNLTNLLSGITKQSIVYIPTSTVTVLVNSNFNCNYYIKREKLLDILKNKYTLNVNYDPCSYPGIICKFYYNKQLDIQSGKEPSIKSNNILKISCMIFRTGSILIVGKCSDEELYNIYKFFKQLLETEYEQIYQTHIDDTNIDVKKTARKKYITITQ